jgi:hypothetical protein
MCAEQVQKNFESSAFSEDKSSTYTSHYDAATNAENRAYDEFSMTYANGKRPEEVVLCPI